jgi:hypothetical protein
VIRALADDQVDRTGGARRQRDGDHLAALAGLAGAWIWLTFVTAGEVASWTMVRKRARTGGAAGTRGWPGADDYAPIG